KCVVCQQFFGKPLTVFRLFVGRIGKDDIKQFCAGSMPEQVEDILLSNSSFQLCFGEIALNNPARWWIPREKNNRSRPAAERLNSKRAASRKKVEDPRSNNGIAQTGKDSSFDTVHRRSHTALRNCQANPAGAAGDHSHGDEAGVGVAVASGSASCGKAEVDGAAGTASSICFFFFFARSFFPPPKKLLIILLRLRPTSLSIKFVLGRSIVPPT